MSSDSKQDVIDRMQSEDFIQHTEEMLAVARRLLLRNVTIYAHECNFVHFGGWSVVAGVERERFRFQWDGRTLDLTIVQGVLVQGQRDWQPIRTLNLQHPEAVLGMETFLYEKFAG